MSNGTVINTGVRVSPEDVEEMRAAARECRSAPVARVHGRWLHEDAEEIFHIKLNALAVRYGLPPPQRLPDGALNHYGMSKDGEFTRWEPASAPSLKREDGGQ